MSKYPLITIEQSIPGSDDGYTVALTTNRIKRRFEGKVRLPIATMLTRRQAVELIKTEIEVGCVIVDWLAVGQLFALAAVDEMEGRA